MITIKRISRSFVPLAAVVASLLAVTAAPALGAVHWSDTAHGIKLSGEVLLTQFEGDKGEVCKVPSTTQESSMGTATATIWNTPSGYFRFECPSGNLEIDLVIKATSTTNIEFGKEGGSGLLPQGVHFREWKNPEVKFINAGAKPPTSYIMFSYDLIGSIPEFVNYDSFKEGALAVTTSTGGTLTLLP